MMAVGHSGQLRVADELLKAGADPNAGTSILHASCDWHFEYLVSSVRYLAQAGWSVNSRDAAGQTALHKAAFLGYAAAIRVLLDHHADPAARDHSGLTPLELARQWKKAAAAKVLAKAI